MFGHTEDFYSYSVALPLSNTKSQPFEMIIFKLSIQYFYSMLNVFRRKKNMLKGLKTVSTWIQ